MTASSPEILDCYEDSSPPCGCWNVEERLQGAVLYLASDASTYTVGHDLDDRRRPHHFCMSGSDDV